MPDELGRKQPENHDGEQTHDKLTSIINKPLSCLENCKSELIILGTGSAMPSKYRNVSAVMIRNVESASDVFVAGESNGHILLDCGEGTYGQLWNICKSFVPGDALKTNDTDEVQSNGGLDFFYDVLREIRFIWISHKHADHLLGLPRILSAR